MKHTVYRPGENNNNKKYIWEMLMHISEPAYARESSKSVIKILDITYGKFNI